MPGLVDRHVHLGLVDAAALAATAVVEVHDLGWVPRIARGWKVDPPTGGVVQIAGPFLTAVGGYPADRAWAPSQSVCELTGPADGVCAVDEGAAPGHAFIKAAPPSGGPCRPAMRARAAYMPRGRGRPAGPSRPALTSSCTRPGPSRCLMICSVR